MASPSLSNAYRGPADPWTSGSAETAMDFVVRQILSGLATATLVQIKSVSGGGVGEPCIVGVQVMVNQIDGNGNAIPHGTINGIPCARIQGGGNALIIDPVVGDIGICVFANRDISAVKANRSVSNPGSFRQFSWSDGVYVCTLLGSTPNRFIRLSTDGLDIVANGDGTVTADALTLDVDTLDVAGNVTIKSDEVGFYGHAPAPKASVTGALSAITDPNAKLVLTSLLNALDGYGLIEKATT